MGDFEGRLEVEGEEVEDVGMGMGMGGLRGL